MFCELTDELVEIRDLARRFAEERIWPIAEQADHDEQIDMGVTKEMGALGFLGMAVPEPYGGAGMPFQAYVVALEEVSRGCPSHAATMVLSNSLFAHPILTFGTENQKKRYLPDICSGKSFGAFALTEPGAGSDAAALISTAVAVGDYYVLNGTKIYVTNGSLADVVIVFATLDKSQGHRAITAFLVEKGAPGFTVGTRERKMGYKASPTCELILSDVRVHKDQGLGQPGRGFNIAMDSLNSGRISIGAQAIGIARAAFDRAIQYAGERVQFGKPIAEFQAIQFMLADMATQIEAARMLVYHAASLKDRNMDYATPAAEAKLYATEMATRVCHQAIQIMGGYGYIREYHAERHYRDARVTEIFEGTSEIQRLVIARNLLRQHAVAALGR
jgi:alkylation response protein AidB-like acyl-CoA dehydrogenase